jgi:putative membrane protein
MRFPPPLLCSALVAPLALLTAASAQQPASAPGTSAPAVAQGSAAALIDADRQFVLQVAVDGMAEVELGKLALQKAASPKVKQFAEQMVQDHGKANAELKALAGSKGMVLPTSLPKIQQDDLTQMGKLSGAAFDKAYSLHMTGDHDKAVAAFDKQAQGSGDAQIKAWAAKTLPTLREHLAAAKALDPGAAKK